MMTRPDFYDALFAYCAMTGGSTTSVIRSRARNKAVGGVAHSSHMYGVGADVVYDTKPVPAMVAEIARRLGLKLLAEGDHDHLQPLDWRAG